MTHEWSSPQWHIIHGADKFASVLIMVRVALIKRVNNSMVHHIPGRFGHIDYNIYYFYIYYYSMNLYNKIL